MMLVSEGNSEGYGRGWEGGEIPIVALAPNFMRPNRRNGVARVVTPGTTSRTTMVLSGSVGRSLSTDISDTVLRSEILIVAV